MAEQRLLFIDIEPKSNSSAPAADRVEDPLWTRSDNTFRFNFLPDSSAGELQEKTSPSPSDGSDPPAGHGSFTGRASAFSFNFQIPPAEDMEATEIADTSRPGGRQDVEEEEPPSLQPEPSAQSKAKKKKKKRGKKNPAEGAEAQPSPAEERRGSQDAELSAEEQLNRQLDWCIEQLEAGMKSQKATPKQKEEASRALKTLRSSKAPLAKKRQVMRAMTGDYRKKMDEDKSKQYKLIQSEIASAQVKVVSDSPKKSVFHRRADVRAPAKDQHSPPQQTEAQDSDLKAPAREETSAFVFTPSKEEFRFNFL